METERVRKKEEGRRVQFFVGGGGGSCDKLYDGGKGDTAGRIYRL